jgi:hypothetical protein
MIYTLVIFTNGMLGAFNMNGEQMPEYQGRARDVLLVNGGLLDKLDKYGTIAIRDWNSGSSIMLSRDQFNLFCAGWL